MEGGGGARLDRNYISLEPCDLQLTNEGQNGRAVQSSFDSMRFVQMRGAAQSVETEF